MASPSAAGACLRTGLGIRESASLAGANRRHARTFLLNGKELKIGKKKEKAAIPETGISPGDSQKGF
jgi:hypothetical protein